MAVGSVYKIGTTSGNIAFLQVLTTPCDDPRADSQDYSAPARVQDGTLKLLGWLQQSWHWDIMSEAQWMQIKSFAGTCSIHTRANSGTMTTYNATLVLPENEPEHSTNMVLDATVLFIKLVTV